MHKEELCKLIEERLKASKDEDSEKVLTAIEPLDNKIQKALKDEENYSLYLILRTIKQICEEKPDPIPDGF